MTYYLGDYYGQEILEEEFKTLTLGNDIANMLKYGIFNNDRKINKRYFDEIMKEIIYENIKKYLPKYTTTFINSGINGKLIFGITDYGTIEGIPFFGNLLDIDIMSYVHKILIDNLNDNNEDEDLIQIIQNIDIEIIELEINEMLLDEQHIVRYNKMIEKINYKQQIIDNYEMKYKKWLENMSKYSGKLSDFINNIILRSELLKYVSQNGGPENVIEFLMSQETVNYEFKYENVKDIYTDRNNYLYWIITYKDYILQVNKKNKPEVPYFKPFYHNKISFFRHIGNVRNHLLKQGCKFYIFKFHIKEDKIKNQIKYKDLNGKWIISNRINTKDGPITTKI